MNGLTTRDFAEATDPFALFGDWFEAAQKSEPNDPNAMALATADADGSPNVRMVLLKSVEFVRICFLQQFRERQGPGAAREYAGGGGLALEIAAAAGPFSRAGDACGRCRGRRIFRQPSLCKAESALGQASNRGHSKAVSRWRPRPPDMPRNLALAKFPGRPIGSATGSPLSISNSGRKARSVCTTVSFSGGNRKGTRGARSASIHEPGQSFRREVRSPAGRGTGVSSSVPFLASVSPSSAEAVCFSPGALDRRLPGAFSLPGGTRRGWRDLGRRRPCANCARKCTVEARIVGFNQPFGIDRTRQRRAKSAIIM